MSNKFYKIGQSWLTQRDGDNRIRYPKDEDYHLLVDDSKISIIGNKSGTMPIFTEVPVTSIEKNNDGAFYSSVAEFIESTASFFNPAEMNADYAGRSTLNSVFGERLVAQRKSDVTAQFQYGFPSGDASAETLNGGIIDIIQSKLRVSSGTNALGKSRIANKRAIRYIPGYEAYLFFTAIFSPGVANSYQRTGLFDADNGFFVGYEGTTFGVTRRRMGVDYFTPVNIGDVFDDIEFNPSFGNIYKISFGYLGFATINFEILHPKGHWMMLHRIEYPNSSTDTHITNTNLPPAMEVANTGNTSNLTIQTGSFSGGVVDGAGIDLNQRNFCFAKQAVTVVPTYQVVAMFRNKTTFNGIKNYIEAVLTLLNPATDLSKNSVWEFRKGMTITNTPTWTSINVDSIMEVSSDATVTADTGSLMLAFSTGKTDRLFEDVSRLSSNALPGETVALIIKTPAATNGTFDISLRWKELF